MIKVKKDSLRDFITPEIQSAIDSCGKPGLVNHELSFSLRNEETDELLAYILLKQNERTCHVLTVDYRKDIPDDSLPQAKFPQDAEHLLYPADGNCRLLFLLLQGVYEIRNADGFPLFYDLTGEPSPWIFFFSNSHGTYSGSLTLRSRVKHYKARSPQDTIHWIRGILRDVGIFTTEQHFRSEGMYYSCRVCIDGDDIRRFDIGTNGKGMTAEYALASAYAELMERLENRMLVMAVKYATDAFRKQNQQLQEIGRLGFRYFPDETLREITSDELWQHLQKLMPGVAKHGRAQVEGCESYKMYYANFFNAMTRKTESLPYHLIRYAASSTGLCAGNEPEEAILQGLNEIFERYVLQQIYLQRLTPPTIPLERFQGTEIHRRLLRLGEEKGWEVIVKDCSLGRGFPVMGLLLIDRTRNRYAFRLGADLSPEIALQRCFTEAFQGVDASENSLQPIFLDDDWDIRKEHNQSVVNGKGRFPRELFGSKPSWEFKGFALKEQITRQEDLLHIKRWLEANGYTLYVRDNSFLGFPAYHVFIPGLSEVDAKLYDVCADLKEESRHFFEVKPEYRLHRLTEEEKASLISKYTATQGETIRLFPFCASRTGTFSRELLLALLSYSLGRDSEAYAYMKSFLQGKEASGVGIEPYYYCVRDVFLSKAGREAEDSVAESLATIYTAELVEEVLSDLKDRTGILRNFQVPDCFHCSDCPLRPECSYSAIIHLEQKVQEAQTQNPTGQSDLGSVFR